jgi:hypothetical protein
MIALSAEEKMEIESLLLTCDGKGKEAKARALKRLLDDAGLVAIQSSRLLRGSVERLVDLRCPRCEAKIPTEMEC